MSESMLISNKLQHKNSVYVELTLMLTKTRQPLDYILLRLSDFSDLSCW